MSDQAETEWLSAVEADHLGKLAQLRAMLIERYANLSRSSDKLTEQSERTERLEASLEKVVAERGELSRDAIKKAEARGDLRFRVQVFTSDTGVDELERALDMIR